ncbi:hypothetical protein AC481_04975 [miscellaneous Crenarchaeota group archaeon SMTZ-80]|nr:MAG: hypothetical protein AC481_04975 [miscellaneous Crenarchaeota group archaeon SMTZ-80]
MNDSSQDELKRAEELILESKMDEALNIVRKIEGKAWAYFNKRNYEEALSLALKCQVLYEKIGNKIGIAYNLILLSYSNTLSGDYDAGLNCGLKSLKLYEDLNNQEGIASSLFLIGLAYNYKGKFNQAIKFCKKSLSIKEINPIIKVDVLSNLGLMNLLKGELDQSLKYSESGLKLAEKLKIKRSFAPNLSVIGEIYQHRGDYNRAKEYHIQSLLISERLGNNVQIGLALIALITLVINSDGPFEEAKKYSERLKELVDQNQEDKFINHCYLYGSAIILLKFSSRTHDRAEAELRLNQVVKDKISNPLIYIVANFYLCEFLIEELKLSNDSKVLDEINPLVNRLLNIAEKTHSYLWQYFAKLLQAKLELIQMNFKEAKLILSQAQQIAEAHDLQMLAQMISVEHDRLLEQHDMWEHLKKTKAPMEERINLASFDGIKARIQGKGALEPDEIVDEHPILLLIIAEGGVLVFSYPFSEEWTFDDELFGGFLTAFNSISDEIFSEGLDRVKFGNQTVLMENIANFSICYLFRGQTYPAKQKFNEFIKRIQEVPSVSQVLERYYKTSQVAKLADILLLEPIILEIFSSKKPN